MHLSCSQAPDAGDDAEAVTPPAATANRESPRAQTNVRFDIAASSVKGTDTLALRRSD